MHSGIDSAAEDRPAAHDEEERQLVADLLRLRLRLDELAASQVVSASRRLALEMAPVLEPVWGLVADRRKGVGFLMQYGTADPAEHAVRGNAAVAEAAVQTYQRPRLLGAEGSQVWAALARPADTLLAHVREPLSLGVRPGAGGTGAEARPTLSLQVDVRPVLPGTLHGSWEREASIVPALRAVLRRWCDLARHSSADSSAGEVARLTLAAALLARGAALDGDTATVRWFVKRWLGLNATGTRVDGTIAALLEDGWTRRTVDAEFSAVQDSVADVRIESLYQHRLHRPVWETELRGAPVALLSDLASAREGEQFDLASGEAEDDVTAVVSRTLMTEQMHSVLDTLSEREAKLVLGLFEGERTQAQLRAELGITRYRFEKIRRDVMRKLRHPSRSQVLRDYLD
ncbi:hypothetical protein [Streptomyces sp. NBC_01615]|uniref:hypothetical protein n=1 Tax=Streptomyces sp. NBC_01615 TaxID=2975898 RepID=UPI003867F7CB